MFGERFKQKSGKSVDVIADLDAILVEPVAFKLHGIDHVIQPITVEQAFRLSNALVHFNDLMQKHGLTAEDIIVGYFDLVQIVAPSVTREDIEKADQRQLASLFSFIVRSFTGELFAEKKKTLTETTKNQPGSLH